MNSTDNLKVDVKKVFNDLKSEIGKVIVGQDKVVELMLTALLTKGHALLVGVPGLAKTMLIKTVASSLNLEFNRIQFTPDLMPSDITGTEILEDDKTSGKRFFKFIKGPLFCNILLADEINRTPPKTQAALLQAMQEGHVTASGRKHEIDSPFLVFATQNPIEQEGTYPLPEAQLDRFMFFIDIDYPSEEEERTIVQMGDVFSKTQINRVVSEEEIKELQNLVLDVPATEHIVNYAVKLVRLTRPGGEFDYINKMVKWGAGPRASQFLVSAAKSRALIHGRSIVDINDIKELALPILKHRIVPTFQAEADNVSSIDIVNYLLENISY